MSSPPQGVHYYPLGLVLGDLVRGTIGLTVVLVPMLAIEVASWVGWILTSLSVLFAGFVLLTVFRARTKIVTDDAGLTVLSPWRKQVNWDDLSQVRLRYYALGSRQEQGWMQLTLNRGAGKVDIDSRIVGFDGIAAQVFRAAKSLRLPLEEVTVANFRSLGMDVSAHAQDAAPDQQVNP